MPTPIPPLLPHHKHWPKRLPKALALASTTLCDNLLVSARRYPDKIALAFLGASLTYAQLLEQVERLATWLVAHGVQRGDRVLLNLQNCPQWVVAHFAVLRAQAVVVPINPMNRAQELQHYIVDTDAKCAITSADLAPLMAQASAALPVGQQLQHLLVTQYADVLLPEVVDTTAWPTAWVDWLLAKSPPCCLLNGQCHEWMQALQTRPALPALDVSAHDLAVLPYTSGTTGLPKGCMHPHSSIMHNAMASAIWINGTSENVSLCAVPMFHITGMVSVMHSAIYLGATLVIMPRWDRGVAAHLIAQWQVTHWTNIPTMVIDLLASPQLPDHALRSLVHIGGGGAAMPQAVAQTLWQRFGLRYIEGYGLTETAAPSHSNPSNNPKQQCLGVPFMSTHALVVVPATQQLVEPGQAGEIAISGPGVFQGYWRQDQATEDAFFEHEGRRFFRSGDVGHVDADGYFFLTDRLKRMINASGFKVWPAEVESLMYAHPSIQEVCIISGEDAYRGETVKAVVVLKPEHHQRVTPQDIIDWCRAHMAVYKAPKRVEFVAALPKSGSGKVMWRALQEAEHMR